jgi:hypothetical protein
MRSMNTLARRVWLGLPPSHNCTRAEQKQPTQSSGVSTSATGEQLDKKQLCCPHAKQGTLCLSVFKKEPLEQSG